MSRVALYRHFGADGALLYIGKAIDPGRRLAEHRHQSNWFLSVVRIEIEWVHSAEAATIEAAAISQERPQYNDANSHISHRLAQTCKSIRGVSQTPASVWRALSEEGLTPTEAAARVGKSPAAARKAASNFGLKFRDARRTVVRSIYGATS